MKIIFVTNLDGYSKFLPTINCETLQVGDQVFLEKKFHPILNSHGLPKRLEIVRRRIKFSSDYNGNPITVLEYELHFVQNDVKAFNLANKCTIYEKTSSL